ncbi:MAG: bifunctional DNA primase/polymerase [Actinomycetota bacterium]|nr:bifunctional DNA primase/polymerase [Actinomycetota bacterium]
MTDQRMIDAALTYARLGWSVVPVHTPEPNGCSCRRFDCPAVGKHPRTHWEAHMRVAAAEEMITGWWERWPDANIGVVTGSVSDVVVLDVDPRNDGDASLQEMEDRWGALPATAVVRTGGGGWHYWFSAGDEHLPSRALNAGLDLKGEGGLVVAPPSMHVSGIHYRWLVDPTITDLAPMPPWLASLARGDDEVTPASHQGGMITRTAQEQEEFSAAWSRAGIDLSPGDRYYHCPFHEDHHPSLHIDRDGCRWFCFGCGLGGGIGALLNQLGEKRHADRTRHRGWVGPRLPITLSGNRTIDVVGESYHQNALLTISGGRRHYGGVELEAVAELIPDPENPYDPNAVEVCIDDLVVGYVRRDDAVELRPAIDHSLDLHGRATCPATIRGGWDRGRGEVGFFGVTLRVPRGE